MNEKQQRNYNLQERLISLVPKLGYRSSLWERAVKGLAP